MAKVALRFYLDSQRDADLMAWLDEQANRSEAIRQALRLFIGDGVGFASNGLNADTLRRVLREELARLPVSMVPRQMAPPSGEDDELRGAMDDLLRRWSLEEQA